MEFLQRIVFVFILLICETIAKEISPCECVEGPVLLETVLVAVVVGLMLAALPVWGNEVSSSSNSSRLRNLA